MKALRQSQAETPKSVFKRVIAFHPDPAKAAAEDAADDICYDCFTRAARKIGLKPGIEDVYAHVKGQKVEGTVDTVPFAVTSAAVTRMVDRWRDQDRAKTARARKATT